MRRDVKAERLEALEKEFNSLLVSCLRECANGRWGLFAQSDGLESSKYLVWPEAGELKKMAREINSLRSEFGDSNALAKKLIEFCSMRGENVKGEPRLARQFLTEMGEA